MSTTGHVCTPDLGLTEAGVRSQCQDPVGELFVSLSLSLTSSLTEETKFRKKKETILRPECLFSTREAGGGTCFYLLYILGA